MSSFEGGNIQAQYNVLNLGLANIFMIISLKWKLMKMETATEILTEK